METVLMSVMEHRVQIWQTWRPQSSAYIMLLIIIVVVVIIIIIIIIIGATAQKDCK
jgi:maltodextrin utilization protein YvdJ